MTSKRIYLSPPHLGEQEINFIQDAFAKNWITTIGENITAFESMLCKLTEAKSALALNSGTAAIHLALINVGVTKGDEVLCSTFTFIATANPIVYLGATPIFIDSEEETWNMCPVLLEQAIKDRIAKGKKPKAILLVHLYGNVAKLDELMKIAQTYEIPLLEDAAESLGSTYQGKMTGTFGLMGIYSFNGNKIITTSSGGALVSNDSALLEHAGFLASQARDPAPHYQHSHIGFNYRMSNVLAGIGRGQLNVLKERISKKRAIFALYKKELTTIGIGHFVEEQENTFYNRWLTTIIFEKENPETIRVALENENIESRPLWKPLHLQPIFKEAPNYLNGTSEKLFTNGLCLPSGTAMTEEEIERVLSVLKK